MAQKQVAADVFLLLKTADASVGAQLSSDRTPASMKRVLKPWTKKNVQTSSEYALIGLCFSWVNNLRTQQAFQMEVQFLFQEQI